MNDSGDELQVQPDNHPKATDTFPSTDEITVLTKLRNSDVLTSLDSLAAWCHESRIERITPTYLIWLRNLNDEYAIGELKELRRMNYARKTKSRSSERNELVLAAKISSEQTQEVHQCRVLVDSGCTISCITETAATRFGLQPQRLPTVVPVRNADGTSNIAGPITLVTTARIEFETNVGTHAEVLTLAITQLGKEEVYLGYDWLRKHNPSIDWEDGSVTFPACSEQCYDRVEGGKEEFLRAHSNISTEIAIKQEETTRRETFEERVPKEFHQYRDLFEPSSFDELPHRRKYDHAIDLVADADIQSWKTKVYPLTTEEQKKLDDFLEENLWTGRIQPSKSPTPSPFFFVKKKSGDLRPVQDYRRLNNITVKNRYPLPLIRELIDKIKRGRVFTKLDVRWGYNNIRIREGDESKAAFVTNRGCFEPLVMFFGLTNSPATFQSMMNEIFRDEINEGWFHVYMDDFLITAEDREENIERTRIIFDKCRTHKLYFKHEKCLFLRDEIDYLGLIIRHNEIRMDPAKTQAISDWPEPRNIKELRSFLGFVNFYRQFVPRLATLTHHLTPLTGKKEWTWTDNESVAFRRIQDEITTDRVLAIADNTLPYRVETDASDFAVSAVLSQEREGLRRPIAFISRSLTDTERNYATYDKEFLAIIFALTSWRKYLLDTISSTEIFCDHRNLSFYRKPQDLSRRQARWVAILQEYDLRISYVKGKQNTRADALSRRPDYRPEDPDNTGIVGIPDDLIFTNYPHLAEDVKNRVIETDFSSIEPTLRDAIANETRDGQIDAEVGPTQMPDEMSAGWRRSEEGLLCNNHQVYIPRSDNLRERVIQGHHDTVMAGHPGIERTLENIQRGFWWPRMRRDVTEYVQGCQPCQRSKFDRTARRAPLVPHDVPARPWHTISIDMIGPLPISHGYDSIIVIVDRFSKRITLEPTTTKLTSLGVANIFVRRVFANWGLPTKIISDRGSPFVSGFMKELYRILHIEKNPSTAYHPQTDGQTERMNQEIETYLRFFTNHEQSDWSQLLPLAEFAYNDHRSASTGFSPFYLTTGRHPWKGFDIQEFDTDNDAAANFATRLDAIHKTARDNLSHTQEIMKNSYNRNKRTALVYKPGDKVWLDAQNLTTLRPSKKLDEKRFGPFEVLEKVGFSSYHLKLPVSWKVHPVFNEVLLRPHIKPRYPNQNIYNRPPPDVVDEEEEYEVDQILDTRIRKRGRYGVRQYLVSWKGYPQEENTWQNEESLHKCVELLSEFRSRHPAFANT
jgi:transposase InsO family protein